MASRVLGELMEIDGVVDVSQVIMEEIGVVERQAVFFFL